MLFAIFLSGNRSAALATAVLFAFAFLPWARPRRRGRWTTLAVGVCLASVVFFTSMDMLSSPGTELQRQRVASFADPEVMRDDSRLSAWVGGIYVGLKTFPFGAGVDYNKTLFNLRSELPSFVDLGHALTTGPHNQFVAVWGLLGLPAFVFLCLIYWQIFKMNKLRYQSSDVHLQVFARYALISYVINSCFHSAGLYNTVMGWFLIAFAAGSHQVYRVSTFDATGTRLLR